MLVAATLVNLTYSLIGPYVPPVVPGFAVMRLTLKPSYAYHENDMGEAERTLSGELQRAGKEAVWVSRHEKDPDLIRAFAVSRARSAFGSNIVCAILI